MFKFSFSDRLWTGLLITYRTCQWPLFLHEMAWKEGIDDDMDILELDPFTHERGKERGMHHGQIQASIVAQHRPLPRRILLYVSTTRTGTPKILHTCPAVCATHGEKKNRHKRKKVPFVYKSRDRSEVWARTQRKPSSKVDRPRSRCRVRPID